MDKRSPSPDTLVLKKAESQNIGKVAQSGAYAKKQPVYGGNRRRVNTLESAPEIENTGLPGFKDTFSPSNQLKSRMHFFKSKLEEDENRANQLTNTSSNKFTISNKNAARNVLNRSGSIARISGRDSPSKKRNVNSSFSPRMLGQGVRSEVDLLLTKDLTVSPRNRKTAVVTEKLKRLTTGTIQPILNGKQRSPFMVVKKQGKSIGGVPVTRSLRALE